MFATALWGAKFCFCLSENTCIYPMMIILSIKKAPVDIFEYYLCEREL